MKFISAEDWQLLSFFEVEPELMEPEDPWPYVDALYRVEHGGFNLSVAIHPAYRDVRIILEHDGHRVYELTSTGVHDVRYIKEAGHEQLQIVINERDTITLSLKPEISIKHAANME